MGTHPRDLLKVTACVNSQHLDRNKVTLVLTFPDVSVPALIQWGTRAVVTKWDFDGSWEQTRTTTYLAQSAQAFLLER